MIETYFDIGRSFAAGLIFRASILLPVLVQAILTQGWSAVTTRESQELLWYRCSTRFVQTSQATDSGRGVRKLDGLCRNASPSDRHSCRKSSMASLPTRKRHNLLTRFSTGQPTVLATCQ